MQLSRIASIVVITGACHGRAGSTSQPPASAHPPSAASGAGEPGVDGTIVAMRTTHTVAGLAVDGGRLVWSDETDPDETVTVGPAAGTGGPDPLGTVIFHAPYLSDPFTALPTGGLVLRISQTGQEDDVVSVLSTDHAAKLAPRALSAPGAVDAAVDGDTVYVAFEDHLERIDHAASAGARPTRIQELHAPAWHLAAGGGRVAWFSEHELRLARDGQPPLTLARGLDEHAGSLVLDANAAYYLAPAAGDRSVLWRATFDGKPPVELAAPDAEMFALRLVDGALYWFERAPDAPSWARIEKLAASSAPGTTPSTIVRDPAMYAIPAFDAAHVYWVTRSCGTPMRVSCIRRANR